MTVLVAGGAGYIGSHTVAALREKNVDVIVIDNMEKGHNKAVWDGAKLFVGDLRDNVFLDKVFAGNKIDAVVDFAAYSLVGESVHEPAKYYDNNVVGTLCLLNAMRAHKVDKMVFSSTAAVYGVPENTPILESDKTMPINPYGETKLAVERMLGCFDRAYGIKYVVLRYFNAAGAHTSAKIGEDHNPETHLIPLTLQAALGKRSKVGIFGDDYNTRDGTCIRDYIHVTDLSDAHILAVDYLQSGGASDVFNLGNSTGFSVKEIIDCARKVTKIDIAAEIQPRRGGDPDVLIASSDKIKQVLNFSPKCEDIELIINSAWAWHKNNPFGYGEHKA